MRVLDDMADLREQTQPLSGVQIILVVILRLFNPRTSSITKYGRPVSVAPAFSARDHAFGVHAEFDDLECHAPADYFFLLGQTSQVQWWSWFVDVSFLQKFPDKQSSPLHAKNDEKTGCKHGAFGQ
jgi:hypothetical protein